MKQRVLLLLLALPFMSLAQSRWELGEFSGVGYLTDPSGSGMYAYTQAGLAHKTNNHRFGGFVNFVIVDVNFNNYAYKSKELAFGASYDTWGELTSNHNFVFWFNPSFKFFRDHGVDNNSGAEAWQNDYGLYVVTGGNINDKQNRWFRSYKFGISYQDPYWSKRTGTWVEEGGFISDKVNFKAVNKAYFKVLPEVTIKKVMLPRWQFEPKLVAAYLYDGGSQNSYYEFGAGFAFAFMREDRYFEFVNLQYRARYGKEMAQRLDLIELNVDFVNLYRLIF
ncbi:hypothetical protein CVU83_00075 [Candidatus Falkowbacteria bacterium HGW-Falkowbacteria-2]|uniref:Bacterial toxin 23 domain-containing protein n=1 Tax=Candidatus Falkowbacteria bacterium HGW-Falkowbacteria-2 TaxID=2013769 RepID=A0A2N2E3V7_9BACT|nr:MAG: hypothetical protein CVU83_00075 [Candidatus Falkowbacteria bacterium HGW-Falkowbacteria-2]